MGCCKCIYSKIEKDVHVSKQAGMPSMGGNGPPRT